MATTAQIELGAARQVVQRLNDPDTGDRYQRWLRRARGCSHPVRLRGASHDADVVTGEVVSEFTSDTEPDGVILKPCGNRRVSVCPACSEVYQGDAWQLVAAGLRGGKGVPETVAEHPFVFATFTAPGFGPVHSVREANGKRLGCRPRSRGETCPHGRSLACNKRHADDDPCLGEAICPDCFDYQRAALWNHNAGRLFKRTRTYVERELARAAGLTQKAARELVRVSYVKVAEFQRRGVVHFHTVWRLDGLDPDGELVPPPAEFDAQLLADAITAALAKASVPAEQPDAQPYTWGAQHETRVLDLARQAEEAGRIAAYIAKYATKASEQAGGTQRRIRHGYELPDLDCRDHPKRLITAAWKAGDRKEVDAVRVRRWAHQLGYGGHCFTKSRRYSTTFKALRAARADHAADQAQGVSEAVAKSDHNLVRVKAWDYAGRDYPRAGDELLAISTHARVRERRRLARLEQDTTTTTGGAA
ncbi:MAG: replication initiation protein [Conexibacteraceae bacterium]|nr:replication initiation protein [Conexibacteraceae bacterium]